MPRFSNRDFPLPPVTCYCGKVFDNTIKRGFHLVRCTAWQKMTVVQQEQHRERTKLLSILRCHNPMKGRFKFCLRELLASTVNVKDTEYHAGG